MMKINELHTHILNNIQGVFSEQDMEVLKEEIEKLKPGDVYIEVGVDEGRSARVAHEYAYHDVYKIYIDINDVDRHEASIGRGPFMQNEGMVGIGKKGFFIHGDGDLVPYWFGKKVNLIFLDPHHDYDSIKSCTLAWEPLMAEGGVMLFHDYDHEGTKKWLDEHYGKEKEILHGKMVRVKK